MSPHCIFVAIDSAVDKQAPNPRILVQAERGKPLLFLEKGQFAAKPTYNNAGKGCWKKRMLSWIQIETLSGMKISPLPAGLSLQENLENRYYGEKQMTVVATLTGAFSSSNSWDTITI